jgi:hypothetical protein
MYQTEFKSYFTVKRLFLLLLLFPLCIGCNQQTDKGVINEEIPDVDPIEGVWKLSNQYWVKDGDTLYLDPEEIPEKQKIYLEGFVIWTSEVPSDSSDWHGFGAYSLSGNTLKENMSSEDEIIYQIELDDTYYKQSTNSFHRGTIYLLVEEWKKLN